MAWEKVVPRKTIRRPKDIAMFNINNGLKKAKHDPEEIKTNLELIEANYGKYSREYRFARRMK